MNSKPSSKNPLSIVLLALAVIAMNSLPAKASTFADDVTAELYAMKSLYSAEYAPTAWKKSFANYDLESEFKQALAAVQAKPNLTTQESREIFKKFIYAMRDYHTSISFVSTEKATLPLVIKGTDSKFFIAYIDRSKLTEAAFPYQIGDEVVSFGGKSTADAVAEVQAAITENVASTDKAMAETRLTARSGARGFVVPQGPITLTILPAGQTSAHDIQLIWDYSPELIPDRSILNQPIFNLPTLLNLGQSSTRSSVFHPQMTVDFAADVKPAATTPYDLGGRKSFTPALGTKVWQSAETDIFDAYIYRTADKRLIAYFRLPSYVPDDYTKALAEFSRDIALFDSTTEGLIIDQVNNPGGSVFYLYALASMLATEPLHTPLHRMSITQAEVSDALAMIKKLEAVTNDTDAQAALPATDNDGYPVSYEFAQFTLNYSRFIVSEWKAGHKLTQPYWIGGVEHINPAATHYTKPVLLLINQLDFSGGDFFPTILQDNKRVTILGARTAGAGGYVNDIPFPNNVGVASFRCTESIAERVSLNPIENLGVTPELPYSMTERDFSANYVDYVAAIHATIDGMTTKP